MEQILLTQGNPKIHLIDYNILAKFTQLIIIMLHLPVIFRGPWYDILLGSPIPELLNGTTKNMSISVQSLYPDMDTFSMLAVLFTTSTVALLPSGNSW